MKEVLFFIFVAERDKWIDVTMYDALESDLHNNGKDGSRFAENDYFADAVCLNSRGKFKLGQWANIFKILAYQLAI